MGRIVLGLCLFTAACSGQVLNSPTSPTSTTFAPAMSTPVATTMAEPAGVASSQAPQNGAQLPFRGTFTRQTTALITPPVIQISGTEKGTASLVGHFTAESFDVVDMTTNTATGTFNLTAANGDQLFADTVGAETEFVPPNISHVVAAATIVGGTGRFAAATGTFTIQLTDIIDFANARATGSGSFEGHVNLNK